jgi:hypothetical protein
MPTAFVFVPIYAHSICFCSAAVFATYLILDARNKLVTVLQGLSKMSSNPVLEFAALACILEDEGCCGARVQQCCSPGNHVHTCSAALVRLFRHASFTAAALSRACIRLGSLLLLLISASAPSCTLLTSASRSSCRWILYTTVIILGSLVYFVFVDHAKSLSVITGSPHLSSQV